MRLSFFYITAASMEEAEKVCQALVKERLAACANVISGIKSFFFWEGEVQNEPEVVIVGKTRSELADKLVEKVKEVHSYEVPCVITWPIEKGNLEFLKWIEEETQ